MAKGLPGIPSSSQTAASSTSSNVATATRGSLASARIEGSSEWQT